MMGQSSRADELACQIATMNRRRITQELLNFQGRFKMDFTPQYLESLSEDRLRHILLAAKLQQLRGN